jgi:hypothetical protein
MRFLLVRRTRLHHALLHDTSTPTMEMGSRTVAQPVFLLVQEMTGLAHASDEVCVVVSSLLAHNEARTRYRNVQRNQAAWNDRLELDIASPHASSGILVQISVLSATSAAGHALLASGACVIQGPLAMANAFCDERLILKRADGNQARLRLAVSWSAPDIAMLYRGLLPCSRKIPLGQPPSIDDLHKTRRPIPSRSAALPPSPPSDSAEAAAVARAHPVDTASSAAWVSAPSTSQPDLDDLRVCGGDEVEALPDLDVHAGGSSRAYSAAGEPSPHNPTEASACWWAAPGGIDAGADRAMRVEEAPWPESPDAGGRGTARMAEAVLKLPPKVLERRGRILISQHAPYKIASMNQAAEDVSRAQLKEAPALGRSVASLDTARSQDLLRACSYVAASSSSRTKARAAILLGERLLVVVQHCKDRNHSMRASTSCLEVLLFFLEDDISRTELQNLFVRVQLVVEDDTSTCGDDDRSPSSPSSSCSSSCCAQGNALAVRRDQSDVLPGLASLPRCSSEDWTNSEDLISCCLPGGADRDARNRETEPHRV